MGVLPFKSCLRESMLLWLPQLCESSMKEKNRVQNRKHHELYDNNDETVKYDANTR